MPSLRRILTYLAPYKTDILLAIVGMFIGTLGMSLIPVQTQRIIDTGIGTGDLPFVIRNGLFMLICGFLTMIGMYINGYFGVRVAQNVTADLRAALYHHIQTLSFGNLDRLNTGNLLVRLTSDITKVQQLVMSGLGILLMAPLLFVWGIVMIYVAAPELALILWVILPIAVGLMIFFGLRSQPMYKSVQQRLSRLNVILQENLVGIRTVKSFVRGDYERSRFGDANQELAQESIDVNQFVAWVMPTLQMAVNVGLVAVIWFGGNLAMQGDFTAGQIVAFINYLGQALMPMMFLGQILPQVAAAEASSARILEVMDSQPDIQDAPTRQDDRASSNAIKGRVVFENVTFSYSDTKGKGEKEREAVLSELSFVAEPGQTVAILGATGSGKSSLVNLIPRFYDVDGGRITIDGVDIRQMPQAALRAHIGICLQEAILFSDEISANIRFGAPDLSEREMRRVAQAADAHGFIQSKADGYETVIGQRGVDLSGGQRQRVSIARALARRPKILILDDSTSAVDVTTERRIQTALAEFTQECTTFIVAQRISTVLAADKIIVLEQGRIVAEGTHNELMESSRHYQQIYESQLGQPTDGAS